MVERRAFAHSFAKYSLSALYTLSIERCIPSRLLRLTVMMDSLGVVPVVVEIFADEGRAFLRTSFWH
ncbi:MAG: hypothetical protein IJ764_06165 [Bacteroidales bacterium]|nr:hypothetical protein [Bacteroidales bacterium]